LIQRRRCVTCVSPALLVDSAAGGQQQRVYAMCARRCVPPPERGMRAGLQQVVVGHSSSRVARPEEQTDNL
ncbi:unnamed protein product, partial [Ectocarpus sp. 12 AP-2014]